MMNTRRRDRRIVEGKCMKGATIHERREERRRGERSGGFAARGERSGCEKNGTAAKRTERRRFPQEENRATARSTERWQVQRSGDGLRGRRK
jgi:hypothetical protein